MKKIIALLVIMMMVLTTFTACGNNDKPADTSNNDKPATDQKKDDKKQDDKKEETVVERKESEGLYAAEYTTLNSFVKSEGVISQLILLLNDTLFDYDTYGRRRAALAYDYEISDDGLTYTFKLKKGIKWYTFNKKEYAECTANDFVYGMKYVLSKDNASECANIVYDVIKNAKEYFDGTITDFNEVGIKAVDDYTVQYTLTKPCPYFLDGLTYTAWYPLNEKFVEGIGADLYGTTNENLLYNGAYIMTEWNFQSDYTLEMNENYWDKEHIYVSKRHLTFNTNMRNIAADMLVAGDINTTAVLQEGVEDDWMSDPEKKKYVIQRLPREYQGSFWFNFEPGYDAEYRPEDWKTAVNNENFRKSIGYAFDRLSYNKVLRPYTYEGISINLMTPRGFVTVGDKDYTDLECFEPYNTLEKRRDLTKAAECKAKAMEELKGKVTFPIILYYDYDERSTDSATVLEQIIERDLGADYIDVHLELSPTTGAIERFNQGYFSMSDMGWGPDYKDPLTWLGLFHRDYYGSTHGKPYLCEAEQEANGYSHIENMINEANAEVKDLTKRYQMFAEAEAYSYEKCLAFPYMNYGGFQNATKVEPFSYNFSMNGQSNDYAKNIKMVDELIDVDQYEQYKATYEAEREEALKDPDYWWNLAKEAEANK